MKPRTHGEREGRGALAGLTLQEENNAPMMAIFGGMFALMLVFLLVVNLYSSAAVRERLEDRDDKQGQYRIERMDGGAGYVVIVFPKALRIAETGAQVPAASICTPGSPFMEYARRVYADDNEQLVFFILEGGIPPMSIARDCLREMWPGRLLTIGWVIADNEFLKSVSLDDIPDYIREYADPAAR